MNNRIKRLGGACCVPMVAALLTASCADGFDSKEAFTQGAGVTNTQLESPVLAADNVSTQVNSDGTESIVVKWPVVFGAGGYLATVEDVTSPSNPVYVVKDSLIDGCSLAFPKEEDSKYEIYVRTAANEKLNNKASVDPSTLAYSTMVDAITIPVGVEISQFIAENIKGIDRQIAFELIGGETYELSGELELGLDTVTIRGNKANRPLVVVTNDNGCISTQGGLRIRNINFDMSAAKAYSFIKMSDNPSESISTAALGYKAKGGDQSGYVIENQISVDNCNFRNLPGSFIWANKLPYCLKIFRINNCIVQSNNGTSKHFINFDASGCGNIKQLVIINSTFYDLQKNSSAFFIKYGHNSSSKASKVYGAGERAYHVISNCTFDQNFSDKDFANMIPRDEMEITLTGNIFYNMFRIYQYVQNPSGSNYSKVITRDNVVWNTDFADNVSHSNDLKFADKTDPEFVGPTLLEFNLDEPKGGVNYHPQNPICLSKKIGDPRWLD